MTNYPTTRLARGSARREVLDRYLERAVRDAHRDTRTIACAEDRHVGQLGGCAVDGTRCLCGCHDPAVTS